jgi:hypothetical protein
LHNHVQRLSATFHVIRWAQHNCSRTNHHPNNQTQISIIYKLTYLLFQIQTQNHQNKSLSTATTPLLFSYQNNQHIESNEASISVICTIYSEKANPIGEKSRENKKKGLSCSQFSQTRNPNTI